MVDVCCTKCNSIDHILEGGFRSGHITEICGDEGTGKTQICLQLLLAAQLDVAMGGLSSFAVYVTSVANYPAGRLAQMVPHVFGSFPPPDLNPLKRILVKKVESPYELIETLQSVEELVKDDRRYRVVVIDSVPSICRFHFHNTRESMKERTSIVNVFSSGLRSLAEKYDVVAIAVNETVKVNPNEQRDCGLQ
ncbi:DNA repair protein XRCC3 homolog [Chenopodium quinoa]|uniref:DNA repair protein XRCC3 homolog n=1 Tax=Chenopodium quinoa TaxID=63459 RepID=UPI000B77E1D9|nr:DNA repair protein XRCC3 homolog [Chenopodium quinoa]